MADRTTVGLSSMAHGMLQSMKEDGLFGEMLDGYRFAIAFSLANASAGVPIEGGKQTFVNVGTLDRDGTLERVICALCECESAEAYSVAERLAEWGVCELDRLRQEGQLDFVQILEAAGTSSPSVLGDERDENA